MTTGARPQPRVLERGAAETRRSATRCPDSRRPSVRRGLAIEELRHVDEHGLHAAATRLLDETDADRVPPSVKRAATRCAPSDVDAAIPRQHDVSPMPEPRERSRQRAGTSASPPVFANGCASDATIRMSKRFDALVDCSAVALGRRAAWRRAARGAGCGRFARGRARFGVVRFRRSARLLFRRHLSVGILRSCRTTRRISATRHGSRVYLISCEGVRSSASRGLPMSITLSAATISALRAPHCGFARAAALRFPLRLGVLPPAAIQIGEDVVTERRIFGLLCRTRARACASSHGLVELAPLIEIELREVEVSLGKARIQLDRLFECRFLLGRVAELLVQLRRG